MTNYNFIFFFQFRWCCADRSWVHQR